MIAGSLFVGSMTGWRLGWLVAPKKLVGAMNRLQQNFYINGGYCKGYVCPIRVSHSSV